MEEKEKPGYTNPDDFPNFDDVDSSTIEGEANDGYNPEEHDEELDEEADE